MKLEYSFAAVPPLMHSEPLPFPDMRTEAVEIEMSGSAESNFPAISKKGTLLCYDNRVGKTGVTVLAQFSLGAIASSPQPTPIGRWVDVPGSYRIGQLFIPLSSEAIRRICRVATGEETSFKLDLGNVDLVDVTQRVLEERASAQE